MQTSIQSIRQRPIIFMQEIDLNDDSQAKKDLINWKPRQRQIPIIEFNDQSSYISVENSPRENNENIKSPIERHDNSLIKSAQKESTNVPIVQVASSSTETSSFSESFLADKTLTPVELDHDLNEEMSKGDKFSALFEQLNHGINDMHESLLWTSTKTQSIRNVYSDRSLSTTSNSQIDNKYPSRLKKTTWNDRNSTYLFNTELHATFDLPIDQSNSNNYKLLARTFIDRTKDVYKLRIAIRNKELENADQIGDKEMVKKLRVEESELANEFIQWKRATKRHYKMLLSTQKNAEKLEATILDLQQKIQHAQNEANRLCQRIEMQQIGLSRQSFINSADKNVQTTERLLNRSQKEEKQPISSKINSKLQSTSFERSHHYLGQLKNEEKRSISSSSSSIVQSSYYMNESKNEKNQPLISSNFAQTYYYLNETQETVKQQIADQNISVKEQSLIIEQEPINDHNSSIVSLIEDENVLGAPDLNDLIEPKIESSHSSQVPPLNLDQLNVVEQQTEDAQLSGKALSIGNDDNKSTANTENDVSSIAFDKEIAEKNVHNFINESIDNPMETIVLQQDLPDSPNTIDDEKVASFEEAEVDIKSQLIEPAPIEMPKNEVIENIEVQESSKEVESQSPIDEEIKSVSVASELPSSAFDNSLADLDTPAQDTPKASSESVSSSSTTSSVQSIKEENKKGKASNKSSLSDPLTASDKSILRVKSFQISSEVQSSTVSEKSANKSTQNTSSSSFSNN